MVRKQQETLACFLVSFGSLCSPCYSGHEGVRSSCHPHSRSSPSVCSQGTRNDGTQGESERPCPHCPRASHARLHAAAGAQHPGSHHLSRGQPSLLPCSLARAWDPGQPRAKQAWTPWHRACSPRMGVGGLRGATETEGNHPRTPSVRSEKDERLPGIQTCSW